MRKTMIVVAAAVLAVGSTSLSTSASAFGLVPLGGFGLIHPGFGLGHLGGLGLVHPGPGFVLAQPRGGFAFAHPADGYGRRNGATQTIDVPSPGDPSQSSMNRGSSVWSWKRKSRALRT